MNFFYLQDLVDEGTLAVKFLMPFEDFNASPVPATLEAYSGHRESAIEFIESRNRRLAGPV